MSSLPFHPFLLSQEKEHFSSLHQNSHSSIFVVKLDTSQKKKKKGKQTNICHKRRKSRQASRGCIYTNAKASAQGTRNQPCFVEEGILFFTSQCEMRKNKSLFCDFGISIPKDFFFLQSKAFIL